MTPEEKAKRYDEAIERARALNNGEDVDVEASTTICEYIFPELKESEDELTWLTRYIEEEAYSLSMDIRDDKDHIKLKNLKKSLIWLKKQDKHLKNYDEAEKEKTDFVGDGFIECHADFLDFKEGETYWLEYIGNDEYNVRSDNLLGKTYHITPCQLYTVFKKLTWLEKQCKKPSTDKVEPKFHESDWVIHGHNILKIQCVSNKYYCIETVGGYVDNMLVSEIDSLYRLWTIKDARDGDVLVDKHNNIGIFKKCKGICWHSHIYLGCNGELLGFNIGGSHEQIDTHPATKKEKQKLSNAIKVKILQEFLEI